MATTARPPRPLADAEAPQHRSLGGQRFAVIDVETTGLKASRHRIVQVAVVAALGDGTVVDRWNARQPAVRLGWGQLGKSMVAAADLRRAPRFAAIAGELVALDGAVLCAHNAGFGRSCAGPAPLRLRTPHVAVVHHAAVPCARPRACDRTAWATCATATGGAPAGATPERRRGGVLLPHLFAEAHASTLDDLYRSC